MALDKLEKGTSLVAATGVVFDFWVSYWLVDRPDTRATRMVTLTLVVLLAIGLLIMFQGWREQRAAQQ